MIEEKDESINCDSNVPKTSKTFPRTLNDNIISGVITNTKKSRPKIYFKMKNYKLPDWILSDVIDTLRQVENYRSEVRAGKETALDRSIKNSKKLLEGLEEDNPNDEEN